MLLRLAMVGLEGLAHPPPKHEMGTEEEFAAKYPFLHSAQDRRVFLEFARKVMLYQPAALLPRVMPTASQNPAEASSLLLHSLTLVTYLIVCASGTQCSLQCFCVSAFVTVTCQLITC